MKPKFRSVLQLAIETGIKRGYQRAYKHNDGPDEQVIQDNIEIEIWNELFEWFDFDEENSYE